MMRKMHSKHSYTYSVHTVHLQSQQTVCCSFIVCNKLLAYVFSPGIYRSYPPNWLPAHLPDCLSSNYLSGDLSVFPSNSICLCLCICQSDAMGPSFCIRHSMCSSLCLASYLSICVSIYHLSISIIHLILSVCPSVHLSVCLCLCLFASVCVCLRLSVSVCVCLSINPPIHRSIHPPIHTLTSDPSNGLIYLFIEPSVHQSIYVPDPSTYSFYSSWPI